MSIKKVMVFYEVKFSCTVEYDTETGDIEDAICDIDIPEGGKNDSTYLKGSFEVNEVEK